MKWCLLMAATAVLFAQSPEGVFLGDLDLGVRKLRFALEIKKSPAGAWSIEMLSLDQGYAKMPIANPTFVDRQLKLSMPRANASYEAEMSADANTFTGKFIQGVELPLVMKRAAGIPLPRRPQVPVAPFPYRSEDVSFPSFTAGVTLAATLTRPSRDGKFPAAILISGSGPQDRDSLISYHRPFFIWADHLTRAGFAVLRYDDRGVGKSTGTSRGATSADLAEDTRGAVAYLRSRADIDATKIFLVGHSEGGMIAPMVAANDAKLAGIVLLAGPAVPGEALLRRQLVDLTRAAGVPEETARTMGQAQFESILQGAKTEPWLQFFLAYDPAPTLAKVTCPVLAVNGELDMNVHAETNLSRIAQVLPQASTRSLPKLNHLLQTATTGAATEYGNIEETVAPVALATVTEWLQARAK